MDTNEFKKHGHNFVEWMGDYLENISRYPVKPGINPSEIKDQIPFSAPEEGEDMEKIFEDFLKIIVPGVTHWQHPSFFGYFPANSSYPSLLAEMLTAAMGLQCMMWETSPAATELEERMTQWLRDMAGLPESWEGVIQDSASSATLVALITAREAATGFKCNDKGVYKEKTMRIYCSTEAHSSIEKGVKAAGFGKENLVKIPVDGNMAMQPAQLENAIINDLEKGYMPLCVVGALGTTGTVAVDPLEKIAEICKKHKLWLHIDAAYAGSALILPEYRHLRKGVEYADSFVFNPHKWLFTNFDCSIYFVKDSGALKKTFEITPEYLKTDTGSSVNNYRDWGIQLGRRFRALKLWFVIRNLGAGGLREKLRYHISLAGLFKDYLLREGTFELTAPPAFNVVCFRWTPEGFAEKEYNNLTRRLLEEINRSGKAFVTHTMVEEKYTIRMVAGQTGTSEEHIDNLWNLIKTITHEITRGENKEPY